MNCPDAKKLIYLYAELSSRERERVDSHIKKCNECYQLYEQLQQERHLLKKALNVASPSSGHELTNRIMAAISHERKRQPSVPTHIFQLFELQPMRYALAAVSFLLVSFFLAELKWAADHDPSLAFYKRLPQQNTVELNSSLYYKELKETVTTDKPVQTASILSLFECIKTCRANQDHSKCMACKTKFDKLKIYDGI